MTTPSPLATPQPWDLVAPAYAEEVAPMFETYARAALRMAEVPAGARIVDVACGPGTLALLAARDGATVDAIDFSQGMLDRLAARAAAAEISAVTPRLGDGQALPYEAGRFAAGFSMFGLMFFPDRAKGFAELRRVLAPGARAVVSSWTPLDAVPVMAAMFGAVREGLARLHGSAPPAPEFPLTTEDACRAEMSAAFADVAVHRVAHVERYPSADALWESLARTMAPIVLMQRSLGEQWRPIADAARGAIGNVVGTGPAEMTMTALLSVGVAA